MNKDLEQMRMLSIGFYVYAGITALFSCIPFIHLFMGIAMIAGAFDDGKNPPPAFLGWLFAGLGGLFIILGWSIAVCTFLAGKYLKQQTHYTFCLAMAAISCIFAPIGTILGVFGIIILMRDSVKELFKLRATSGN